MEWYLVAFFYLYLNLKFKIGLINWSIWIWIRVINHFIVKIDSFSKLEDHFSYFKNQKNKNKKQKNKYYAC